MQRNWYNSSIKKVGKYIYGKEKFIMKKIKALITALVMLTTSAVTYGSSVVQAEGGSVVPDGTYMIRNVNSGIYLDVAGGVAADGTNVQQWNATSGQAYNMWRFEADENGDYKIYSMLGDGDDYCLAVESSSELFGDNVCIQQAADTANQLYTLSANSDGSFKLLTKCSNGAHAVEVINAETSSGSNVQQWEVNGANCQDWELIPIKQSADKTETKVKVEGEVFEAGDLNDDGVINVFDNILAKREIKKPEISNHRKYAANVNGDADFTSDDISVLQKYLTNKGAEIIKQQVETTRKYAAVDGKFESAYVETTNAGFESDAYLNLYNEKGLEAAWNVVADADGVYAVTFRYANGGTANRNLAVNVGNELVYWNGDFAPTGAWTTWGEQTLYLPLKAGVNLVTVTSLTDEGAPNIDHITIAKTDKEMSAGTPIDPIVGKPYGNTTNTGTFGVGRQMEALDRGLCAAYTGSGMLVSWRSLATDPENTTFKLYKNGALEAEIAAADATTYLAAGATATDVFTLDTYFDGMLGEKANSALVLSTKNSGQSGAYMDITLEKPADQTMPDGTTCTYTPNDASVGDADGDGEYEIYLKWDPSNSKDNANDGYTGTVFIDCYKLDGTRLFRIDLGKNIRAGAHYTQFMVYDFDGDGKSELICKTADGTVDGKGKTIGSASADYRSTAGRILSGPEYLTLFDGYTGEALDTIDYEPGRGSDHTQWGDNYGNRVDRFLAGVAYLDGQTPSAIFARGYYTRTGIAAYDVKDNKLVKKWLFDTGHDSSNAYYGQGNHSLIVMDVDADGKDEILYGSCCIDDNGKGLWSTKLGHGDCMQAGDLIPERPGLEVFQVHEHIYCAEIHDAKTGEIIWRVDGSDDVGRGIGFNFDASNPGMEFTSVTDSVVYGYNPSSGKVESRGYSWSNVTKWGMNSAVWYDGDLEREVLDRTMVDGYNKGRLFTGDGASYNNYSKSNACITADIFGDWREELIFYANGGTTLRIFGTTHDTDIKLFTLMHDSQYRTGVAIENVGYNQAPNTSFFLGTGYDMPKKPTIYTINANE